MTVMNTNDNLFKWDFERELIKLALECTGLAKSTARRKANKLWDKYHDMVGRSQVDLIRIDKELLDNRKAIRVFREGRITWAGNELETKSGTIALKQIEQIEIFADRIVLITLSGREIRLAKSFDYLGLVFHI